MLDFVAATHPSIEAAQTLELAPAAHRSFVAAVAGGSASSSDDWPAVPSTLLVDAAPGQVAPGLSVLSLAVRRHVVTGDPSQMNPSDVARIGVLRRRVGLSRSAFQQHYLQRHVPLVMDHGPLFHHYSVCLVSHADEPWDAIVWQTFDSLETWAEHDRLVMEEKPAVREDLATFVGELVSFEARLPMEGARHGFPSDRPSRTGEVGI